MYNQSRYKSRLNLKLLSTIGCFGIMAILFVIITVVLVLGFYIFT